MDSLTTEKARAILAGTTRFTVPSWYGDAEIEGRTSWPTFEEAVEAARSTITRFEYPGQTPDHRYSTACVALRCEHRYAPYDGVSLGADEELLRWRVTRSRVVLAPEGSCMLGERQVQAAEELTDGRKGWA